MDTAIGEELAARMRTVRIDDEAGALVLAACESEESLSDLVGGTVSKASARPVRNAPPVDAAAGVFLRSLSVEGFRGIGPVRTLVLQPGPGLTLVIGRNGSGKSSFAEALELLLTGSSQRWAHRSMAWREDWRNLHHTARTAIRAEFTVEGHRPMTVAREWPPSRGVTDGEATAQHKGEPRRPFAQLGWEPALGLYRPFLSYNELGSILDEGPSKLFDAIARVLGVEDLVAVADRLNGARKWVADLEKSTKAAATALADRLRGNEDPRATTALTALARSGGPAVETVEALLEQGEAETGTDDLAGLRRLASLSGPDLAEVAAAAGELRKAAAEVVSVGSTDAGAARELAELLAAALAHHRAHGDGDCPVCGSASALDADWRARAETRAGELRAAAANADAGHRRLDQAERAARGLATGPPPFLGPGQVRSTWQAWAEVATSELAPDALAAALEAAALALDAPLRSLRDEAAAELSQREDLWRPVARELAAWAVTARRARSAAATARPLKEAYDWVQAAAADARRERFAPIAEHAKAIWDLLRQQSSVELSDIVLAGTTTNRRVVLDVKVDGVAGAALGVMSQGELHSLALSLFLPRATMETSPFRFVVVDDPVQSMDPARVDGLARVLEVVATSRQVVVFTHDDRLPEATRRLRVPARVLEVSRRSNSDVDLRNALDPTERALDDARALVRTKELPPQLARFVVPSFCRLAIEARCADVVRRRRLERGEPHQAVEDALLAVDRLGAWVSLALFDDADRDREAVGERLRRKFGPRSRDVLFRCNRGVHRGDDGDLGELVRDVELLVDDIDRLT